VKGERVAGKRIAPFVDGAHTIFVCQGTGCLSAKSEKIRATLAEVAEQLQLKGVKVDFTGCHGLCQRGPVVVVEPEGVFYSEVKPEDANEIMKSLKGGKFVERLFYRDLVTGRVVPHYKDVPFYAAQQRLILRNCGRINPERIDDYIATGGYEPLRKALLNMTPEQVLDEVKRSGLRGRGGAGFPTGRKWELCRRAQGEPKYIICNADEGDPGAYMDRSILEADPHSVIEGMIIGAYAIGAKQGFIYVRAEYPVAIKRFRIALQQAEERGFLGLYGAFSYDFIRLFEDIPTILDPIRSGKADMVIGSRYLGGSEELHGDFNKFLRMLFSMCIAQIMNWRFKTSVMDTQNGFRAIKADVIKKLKLTSNHTEIETEMCMKCCKKGFKIVEVPSRELKRKFGKSNISLTRDGFKYIWAVIKNLF